MIINENRINNNLPGAVDNFLHDFAQVYGGIGYNDIIKLSNKWSKVGTKINSIISKIRKELKNYAGDLDELANEDPSVKKLCNDLVKLIKS